MRTRTTPLAITSLAIVLATGIAHVSPSAEAMIIRDLPLSTQNGSFTTDPILRVKVQEKGEHKLRFTFKNLGGGSINDIFFEKGLFTNLLRRNTTNARVLPFSQGVSFAKRSDVPESARSFTQLQPHDAENIDWQGQPLSFHALGTDRINNGLKAGDKLHVYVPKRNGVTLADLEAVLFNQPGRITWAAEEFRPSGITAGGVFTTGNLTIEDMLITTGGAQRLFIPEIATITTGGIQISHQSPGNIITGGSATILSGRTFDIANIDALLEINPRISFDTNLAITDETGIILTPFNPALLAVDPTIPSPSVAASTLFCGGSLLARRRRAT